MHKFTWENFDHACVHIHDQTLDGTKYTGIYGVLKGGVALAIRLGQLLNIPIVEEKDVRSSTLVCDDIIDSGATRLKFKGCDFVSIFSRMRSYDFKDCAKTFIYQFTDDYINFPWETKEEHNGEDIVLRMLEFIGEDPTRPGLEDTPKRITKMWKDVFKAYKEPPPNIMVVKNGEDGIVYDEMIRDQGYFYSHCEHHGVPFFGTYHFAYVPNNLVMGASKIGRTINYYCSRLQVAERLVSQIADRIEEVVQPKGLMLIMDARHLCKEMRGLRMYDSPFGVDVVRGVFKDKTLTYKQEFLSWIGNSK